MGLNGGDVVFEWMLPVIVIVLSNRLDHFIIKEYFLDGRFEENMRAQRERRNDPKWNFCDYFLLQEELAFVYEMLGQFDEALVQYDELDALFTQFVLNSHIAGEKQVRSQVEIQQGSENRTRSI